MNDEKSCSNCLYEAKGCDCQSCFLETVEFANWKPKNNIEVKTDE